MCILKENIEFQTFFICEKVQWKVTRIKNDRLQRSSFLLIQYIYSI